MTDAQIMIYGRWKSLAFLKYLRKSRETTKAALAVILNPNILTTEEVRQFAFLHTGNWYLLSKKFFLRRGGGCYHSVKNSSRARDQSIGSHNGVDWGIATSNWLLSLTSKRLVRVAVSVPELPGKEVRVLNCITRKKVTHSQGEKTLPGSEFPGFQPQLRF